MSCSVDPPDHNDNGITRVTACFGYTKMLDIRRALRLLYPAKTEGAIAITTRRSRVESYYLPQDRTPIGGMQIEV